MPACGTFTSGNGAHVVEDCFFAFLTFGVDSVRKLWGSAAPSRIEIHFPIIGHARSKLALASVPGFGRLC